MELEKKLEAKKRKLGEKRAEVEEHKKFNDFLEQVVNDKNGDNKEFEDIEALQNRFKNLKSENEKLMKRKQAINREMEEARTQEKVKLNKLQNDLYEM